MIDLPKGAFVGTGVQTVVLFFRNLQKKFGTINLILGKTNSLEQDLEDFVTLFSTKKETYNHTYSLAIHNPNCKEVIDERSPHQILKEIEDLLTIHLPLQDLLK